MIINCILLTTIKFDIQHYSLLYIPPDIHFVQFTWNDEQTMYYEYNTSSNNEQILLRPVLNIVEKGIVPRDISSRRKLMNFQ